MAAAPACRPPTRRCSPACRSPPSGLATYVALLASHAHPGELARIAGALVALTGFGFSAYLTYESVTVIGATCQWCLVSAGLMTVLAGLMVAGCSPGTQRAGAALRARPFG